MKKKFFMMLLALTVSAASFAQFEKNKVYANASFSGVDVNFTGLDKFKVDVQGKVGYFLADNWMLTARGELKYRKHEPNYLLLGAGVRYYILQNGLYLGAGADYAHQTDRHSKKVDDLLPSIQLGYAYFLSRTVTIEPELYYAQSFKNHGDYSGFGLRIGVGIYLGKD